MVSSVRTNYSTTSSRETKVHFAENIIQRFGACGAMKCEANLARNDSDLDISNSAPGFKTSLFDNDDGGFSIPLWGDQSSKDRKDRDNISLSDDSVSVEGRKKTYKSAIKETSSWNSNKSSLSVGGLGSETIEKLREMSLDTVESTRSYLHVVEEPCLSNDLSAKLNKFCSKAVMLIRRGDTQCKVREFHRAKHCYEEALNHFHKKQQRESKYKETRIEIERQMIQRIDFVTHLVIEIQHSQDVFTIGMVRLRRDEYDKALKSFNVALRMRKAILGERHPTLSKIYNYIAISYAKMKEFDNAFATLQKSIRLLSSPKNMSNIEYAIVLQSYGHVHEENDDVKEALMMYFQSLTLMLNVDTQHTNLGINGSAMSLSSLPTARHVLSTKVNVDTGVYAVACDGECVELVKNIDVSSLPEDPKIAVEVCLLLNKMSQLYRRINHIDTAIALSSSAITCLKSAIGSKHHPKVMMFLRDASLLYKDAGDYDLALKICGQVLVMNSMKNVVTKENTDSITSTLFNLGCIEHDGGSLKKAMKFLQDALGQQMKLKFTDRNNVLVAHIMMRMGCLYEEDSCFLQAEQSYCHAIQTLISYSGANKKVELARMHHKYGQYYQRRRLYDDALFELNEGVKAYHSLKRFSEKDHEYVMLLRDLADVKVELSLHGRKSIDLSCGMCGIADLCTSIMQDDSI